MKRRDLKFRERRDLKFRGRRDLKFRGRRDLKFRDRRDLKFRERRESLQGEESRSRSEQKVSKTTAGGDLLDICSSLATDSHLQSPSFILDLYDLSIFQDL